MMIQFDEQYNTGILHGMHIYCICIWQSHTLDTYTYGHSQENRNLTNSDDTNWIDMCDWHARETVDSFKATD